MSHRPNKTVLSSVYFGTVQVSSTMSSVQLIYTAVYTIPLHSHFISITQPSPVGPMHLHTTHSFSSLFIHPIFRFRLLQITHSRMLYNKFHLRWLLIYLGSYKTEFLLIGLKQQPRYKTAVSTAALPTLLAISASLMNTCLSSCFDPSTSSLFGCWWLGGLLVERRTSVS